MNHVIDKFGPRHPLKRITLLRDPHEQLMSKFYHFCLARKKCKDAKQFRREWEVGEPISDEFKIAFLRSHTTSASEYVAPCDIKVNRTDPGMRQALDILHSFDLAAVTERFDESLLVFRHMFDLTYNDILYFPSKKFKTGEQDDEHLTVVARPEDGEGPAVTRALQEAVAANFSADVTLHRVASLLLDEHIDRIGRKNFEQELAWFEGALACAQAKCERFRHSQCIVLDLMCGYKCFHSVDLRTDCNITVPHPHDIHDTP